MIEKFVQKEYGLAVTALKPLEAGVVNKNYRLSASEGDFILKIYTKKISEEIQFEINVLRELTSYNFPSPHLRPTVKGAWYSLFHEKPAVFYPFILGTIKKELNVENLREVGALMGKMHHLLSSCENRSRSFLWDPENLKTLLRERGGELRERGFPRADELVSFLSTELELYHFPDNLPSGVTHQDIKPENILIEGGHVSGIVDFDNAYFGYFLFDIATTVIWSCFRGDVLDGKLVEAFRAGYENERPLAHDERELFNHAILFRLLREAFIGPFAAARGTEQITRKRSDYFLWLYKNFKSHK